MSTRYICSVQYSILLDAIGPSKNRIVCGRFYSRRVPSQYRKFGHSIRSRHPELVEGVVGFPSRYHPPPRQMNSRHIQQDGDNYHGQRSKVA